MAKISVIVVCYNEASERIVFTMDSIISQNYSSIEIVVVDGGSLIETLNTLNNYRRHIKVFVSEPDSGLYDAMNKGISKSSGEWIIFMNVGDKFHESDTLTRMMSHLKCGDISLIYGDVLMDGMVLTRAPRKLKKNRFFYDTVCHQAMLIRREAFDSIGVFDISLKLLSDRDWTIRFINSGFKYLHVAMIVCDWEVGGAGSDWKLARKELSTLHCRYFSRREQLIFSFTWFAIKLKNRLMSLNFSMPISIRDKYAGPRKNKFYLS